MSLGWRTLRTVGLSCILRHYISVKTNISVQTWTARNKVLSTKMLSCQRGVLTSRAHLSQTVQKATISFWCRSPETSFTRTSRPCLVPCNNPFFLLVLLFRKIKNALRSRALQGIQNIQKGEKIRLRYPVLEVECYIVLVHTKLRGLSIYHCHVSWLYQLLCALWVYSTAVLAVCIRSVKRYWNQYFWTVTYIQYIIFYLFYSISLSDARHWKA